MGLVLDFILVTGIAVINIILFLLLKFKQKLLSQKILIVFFVLLLFVAVFSYANLHDLIWLLHITFIPNDVTVVMIGPLLYLYIKSLFLEEKNLIKHTLKHFIPAGLYLILIAVPTLIYSIFGVGALSYVISKFIAITIKLENVYLILYLILSLQQLSKYRSALKNNYSNLSKYDYHWIKIMLIGVLFIISIYLTISIYELLYKSPIWYQDYLITVIMILFIIYLGYYGINQSKVLVPNFLLNQNKPNINKSKKIYSSDAKREEFELLEQNLESVLKAQKPYLEEDLTLGKLAKQLSTTDKKLSILLNQYMNTTFYDLINKYRVNAVIEKMKQKEYKNYSLFGIACDCGFKSRTSFNRTFKKETGLPPSVYKENLS